MFHLARLSRCIVSRIVLTICLVALLPESLNYASTWRQVFLQESDSLRVANYVAPMGFASLAIIIIGLTVIWTGYSKQMRWAWFLVFVITWVFIFPVYILPLILLMRASSSSFHFFGWIGETIHVSGPSRTAAERFLLFALMNGALFLPINAFFRKMAGGRLNPS